MRSDVLPRREHFPRSSRETILSRSAFTKLHLVNRKSVFVFRNQDVLACAHIAKSLEIAWSKERARKHQFHALRSVAPTAMVNPGAAQGELAASVVRNADRDFWVRLVDFDGVARVAQLCCAWPVSGLSARPEQDRRFGRNYAVARSPGDPQRSD